MQIKRQQVEYAQDQSGTTLAAIPGGETDPGGGQVRSSLDPGDFIAINNVVNLTNMTKQVTFRYAGGANGVAVGTDRASVEMRLDSPTGPIAATATLKSTGTNNNTYTSQTFPLDFAGSHRVYFVFRTVAGGPATGHGQHQLGGVQRRGHRAADRHPAGHDGRVRPAVPACGGTCLAVTKLSLVTLTGPTTSRSTSTEYRVDGGAWQTYSAPFRLNLTAGLHTFEYRSTDVDGNVEAIEVGEPPVLRRAWMSASAARCRGVLSLSVATPAPLGPFAPGVAAVYNQSVAASVTSTAGNAALSVTDPSDDHTGHLVNGTYWLPSPLQVAAGGPFAAGGRAREPDVAEELDGSGLERPGHRLVPPVDRRRRRPAGGHLREDARVRAVDDVAIAPTRTHTGGPLRRAAPALLTIP